MRRMCALLVWMVAVAPAWAGLAPPIKERHVRMAGLNVAIWEPRSPIRKKSCPLVLFSHGNHGSNVSLRSLMVALAEAGYWVVAPNHQDAIVDTRVFKNGWRPPRKIRFKDVGRWTNRTYSDRGQDLRRVLSAISEKDFPGLDRSRVALVGHSLGGYTALCVAGARPDWAIKGSSVKAVVAMSSYVLPLLHPGLLPDLKAPVMFQDGTRDRDSRLPILRRGGAYDQVRSPKVYVEIQGAEHLTWTNARVDPLRHALINRYVVAFLNHFVKGEPADRILTHPVTGISGLRNSSVEEAFQANWAPPRKLLSL